MARLGCDRYPAQFGYGIDAGFAAGMGRIRIRGPTGMGRECQVTGDRMSPLEHQVQTHHSPQH